MASAPHRVVIVGGGFGGLYAAQNLRKAPVEVTLIDRRNFHLFQPLLYQVAAGGLSPANIATPLRSILKKQRNCRVLLGEATGFDVAAKEVLIGTDRIAYDSLIVAAGAGNSYFNHPEWEKIAPGLKTIEDATAIRARVLSAFEAAERFSDEKLRRRLLTFVIVGGGATGVEMAGTIVELARYTLRHDFRAINPATARIILIEGHNRVLPPYHPSLSAKAERALVRLGVEIWTSTRVLDIKADHLLVDRGGKQETLEASTVIWAAGVSGNPLGKILAEAVGASVDRGGRIAVGCDLSLAGHPEIFVIGDLASAAGADGKPLPGVAPVAMQQGKYVAKLIRRRVEGHTPLEPFRYFDKGSMATIGRNAAVVDLHFIRFSGWFAWVTWLFVHIMFLIQFQNRLLVLFQWFWSYATRNRSARLITGDGAKDGTIVEVCADRPPNETSRRAAPHG